METESNPTPQQYQQVTVEVPQERVAEFHAFFARFLAGRGGRGGGGPRGRRRYGRHGGHGRGPHGRRCGQPREEAQSGAAEQPADVTEV